MAQLRAVPIVWGDERQEAASPQQRRSDRILFYAGDRIYLRPIEVSDEFLLRKWLNDPVVRQGLDHLPPTNAAREQDWIESQATNTGEYHVGIVARAGDRLIGTVSLVDIDAISRSAELRIMIGDVDYHSRGFGTEAVKLIVRYGFEELNLNRISLGVFANNPKAIRCYQKAGFVQEGCFRQAVYRGGKYVDEYAYAILREEWEKGRRG